MSKIFKPRRGKASTMNGTKSSTVLAAGEMFIELPDTGVGTGICKMKMGDGVTAYSSLPYAMGGDIASTEITGSIVADTSDDARSALANVTTGRTLGAIIGSLRRACEVNANSIQKLNDDRKNDYKYLTTNIKIPAGTSVLTSIHGFKYVDYILDSVITQMSGYNYICFRQKPLFSGDEGITIGMLYPGFNNSVSYTKIVLNINGYSYSTLQKDINLQVYTCFKKVY